MKKQPRLFPTPPRRTRGRVTDGLERTLIALEAGGRLEPADAVWIALAREACEQYQTASRDPDVSEYVRNGMLRGTIEAVTRLPIGPDADNGPTLYDMLAALGDATDSGPADGR